MDRGLEMEQELGLSLGLTGTGELPLTPIVIFAIPQSRNPAIRPGLTCHRWFTLS